MQLESNFNILYVYYKFIMTNHLGGGGASYERATEAFMTIANCQCMFMKVLSGIHPAMHIVMQAPSRTGSTVPASDTAKMHGIGNQGIDWVDCTSSNLIRVSV